MRSDPELQATPQPFGRIRIRTRLTLLALVVTVPFLIGINLFNASRSEAIINEQANRILADADKVLATKISTWLGLHVQALHEMASLPDVVSMDPGRQKPILKTVAAAYPNLYLVNAVSLKGTDVARSDEVAPKDYHDREWFQGAASGAPITFQVLISRTLGKPALSMSTPIRNASGDIVGVAAIHTTLDDVSSQVLGVTLGKTGYVYVVDATNHVVAHPDPEYTEQELRDLSSYPPVVALRRGDRGLITFVDNNGVRWRAYVDVLDNNWGIIAQQTEAELVLPAQTNQRISLAILLVGVALMALLTLLALRRALQPVDVLTTTVTEIAAGNLDQVVPVRGQDEFGQLGLAFNSMTRQVRELISGLEQRVEQRTAELAAANQQISRRASQLEIISKVSEAIAGIRDLNTLLPQITHTISDEFGYYHTGIFLLDDTKRFAVLSAANSAGGRRMLDRSHRLKVGEQGIVGYVAANGVPRIALDTGADSVFFNNPDLPATRSEIALPLLSGRSVIGVLDVQSEQPFAFKQDDIKILTALANQVSIAIQNARLFEETQRSLNEIRSTYGEYLGTIIGRSRAEGRAGYRLSGSAIMAIDNLAETPEIQTALEKGEKTVSAGTGKQDAAVITVPIKLRNEIIGVLDVRMPQKHAWNTDEVDITSAVAERVALAVENASLLEDSQRRAVKERAISDITSKISASINLRNILQTAVEELGHALPGSDVIIQIQPDDTSTGQP